MQSTAPATCPAMFFKAIFTQNVAEQLFCHVFSLQRVAKMAAGVVFFQFVLQFCIIFSTAEGNLIFYKII